MRAKSSTKRLSLRVKLTLWVVSIVLMGFAVTIAVLANRAAGMQQEAAHAFAEQLAARNGAEVAGSMETALDTATALANALGSMQASGVAQRDVANAMLKGVLEGNPAFLGVWTGWEPNAFDAKDGEYVGQSGHDATGRFVPYWNKGLGMAVMEALVDYDKPGAGDYYLVTRQTGKPLLRDPYRYSVAGKETLITSVAVPVQVNGSAVGVVGVDMALASLQGVVGQIRIFDSGYATLLSHGGLVVGDRDAESVGQDMAKLGFSEEARAAVKAGQPLTVSERDERLGGASVTRLYVPVRVGSVPTPWMFVATVPEAEILAGVNRLMLLAAVLGLASVVLVSVGLSVSLERLVLRPLGGEPAEAAAIANRVAQGDLSQPIALRNGDSRSLMAQLSRMQASLVEVVSNVRHGAQNVATASAEISHGNQDLSSRTENQASALEQTAASMEELGSTVRQNADSARQANQLALDAAGVLPRALRPRADAARRLLRAARGETPQLVEVLYRHRITSEDGFRMRPGFASFDAVREGQPLATDRAGEVTSPRDGHLLMPLYQPLGDDGFFVARPVARFWFELSATLRRLRVEGALRLLPGIGRHPRAADSFVVHRRVARGLVRDLFHLLGYRRIDSGPKHVVYTRRPEGL